MVASERQIKIQQLVRESKYLTIDDLSKEFLVSPSTVRRDLKVMEDKGLINLLYGGIVMKRSPLEPYSERECRYVEEKKALAKAAALMVKDGDVLVIDAGSTASQVAQAIADREDLRGATIVTPAINVARLFLHKPGFRVLLTGGELTLESEGMLGRVAETFFSQVRAHKVFLSCVGLTGEAGVMYADHDRAALRRAMVDCSNEVILVVDHSKFGKIAAAQGFATEEIDVLITDEKTRDDSLAPFLKAGVDVKKVSIDSVINRRWFGGDQQG